MSRIQTRARVATALTAALVTAGLITSAAPAQAVTWDHARIATLNFLVAGKRYTLFESAVGQQQTTEHIGQHTGSVWSNWRILIKDDHGHVLQRVDRSIYAETAIVTAFSVVGFPTVKAFRIASHRVLTISAARAKAAYLKGLRSESVDADQESNIGQVFAYLDGLPAGATLDFNAVAVIHSSEYRGSVTVSGSDAKHWSVIVRDTQDGFASFYDSATGTGSRFAI